MGKNKKKMKPDSQHSPATVFVTNLPYTFSNSQLEETFSDVGPIRRCFMVTQKGSTEHRGFAYVQFAVTEDANRAIELKNGSSIGGRTIGVKQAMHRAPLEQRRPKGNEVVPSDDTIKGEDDTNDIADDVVKTEDDKEDSLLHSDEVVKTKDDLLAPIVKHKKAHDSKEQGKIDKPKKGATSLKTELVEGTSLKPVVKHKQDPVSQEKGKLDKPKKAVIPIKTERVEGISSEKQRVARTVVIGGLHNKDMAEDVHRLAKECGAVASITFPLPKEEITHHGLSQDGCRLGASSIVYASVKSARSCVTKIHQKVFRGGTVWARQLGGEGSKVQKWKLIIRNLPFKADVGEIKEMFSAAGFVWDVFIPKNLESGLAKGFAFVKFTCKQDAENAIQKFNGKIFGKRTIAVDWAISKKIYTAGTQAAVEDGQKESDDEDFDSDLDDDRVEIDRSTHHSTKDDADMSDSSDLVDEELNFDEEAVVARKVLNNFLSMNGPVASVNDDSITGQKNQDDQPVIVLNEVSDGHKNVLKPESSTKSEKAFVKPVETEEELERTLFISNLPFDVTNEEVKQRFTAFGEIQSLFLVLHPITKRPRGTGFLKFKTLEAADAAFAAATSVAGLGIILKGRQLKVLKALNKKAAHEKEVEKTKKEEIDHRNLYLAKEGIILEGTPAAEGVSDSDLSKRRSLEKKKATKLQSPNFHVSRTRLIMYNVPKSMNDKQLKRLCLEAVKSRATKQKPMIRQIKLLKDSDKGKEVSKNHSRGVAFIEFSEHQHALVALRVLNNNPGTFTAEHRPIVEFALDNVQTLRQRNEKIEAQRQELGNNSEKPEKKTDFPKPFERSNEQSRKRKSETTHPESRNDDSKVERRIMSKPGAKNVLKVQEEAKKKRSRDEKELQNEDLGGMKRRKNKEPLGKDTVDKLDLLIEQYRSKFSGNRNKKNEGENEGPRKLGRWFQS